MPTLTALTTKRKEALGITQGLIERYEALLETSKSQSLKDNKDAMSCIDDAIKRLISIQNTKPHTVELRTIKDARVTDLQKVIAELCLHALSQPADVALKLEEIGYSQETIAKVVEGMEQQGGNEDDFAILLSLVATSETSLICADGGHSHSHGHSFGGVHNHTHRHW